MKSILSFCVFFIFCLHNTIIAQVAIGPEAGVGMSSMHFAPANGFTAASGSALFSWRAGGIADIGMNKKLYLQTGLFLSRKGQSREFSFYKNDSVNEAVQQTLQIYYIDVPVTVVYKTGTQGKGRFFVGLGVTPSYILGGSNKLQAQGKTNDTPFVRNVNNNIVYGNPLALFDLGVNLTAGYELPEGLFFRAYYVAGAKDIGLGSETDKNRMWGVGGGYIFSKGRKKIIHESDDLIDRPVE